MVLSWSCSSNYLRYLHNTEGAQSPPDTLLSILVDKQEKHNLVTFWGKKKSPTLILTPPAENMN